MRILIVLMATTALAACSGGEAQTAGGNAVSSGGGGSTPATPASSFVNPTQTKVYQAQGAVQYFEYRYNEALTYTKTKIVDANGNDVLDALGNRTYRLDPNSRTVVGSSQGPQLYAANAATVRNPGITVTYDPRNAQFTVQIAQNGLTDVVNFQDPLHRTDFSGLRTPQNGVPNLEIPGQTDYRLRGVQYLEAATGSSDTVYDKSTFFYELPGTNANQTQYVTYAGFVRNHYEEPIETILTDGTTTQTSRASRVTKYERAAFVYGEQTGNSAVPTTGSATYTGKMIGSVVNNPQFDTSPNPATYFQWMSGTASVDINFATKAVNTTLSGTLGAPLRDTGTSAYSAPLLNPSNTASANYPTSFLPGGATFSATGTATIDLVTTGGFTGTFGAASFTSGATTQNVSIAGSSLDGAFYGPAANEIGASFRIVGGVPDQRVDVIGAFTGKKP